MTMKQSEKHIAPKGERGRCSERVRLGARAIVKEKETEGYREMTLLSIMFVRSWLSIPIFHVCTDQGNNGIFDLYSIQLFVLNVPFSGVFVFHVHCFFICLCFLQRWRCQEIQQVMSLFIPAPSLSHHRRPLSPGCRVFLTISVSMPICTHHAICVESTFEYISHRKYKACYSTVNSTPTKHKSLNDIKQ